MYYDGPYFLMQAVLTLSVALSCIRTTYVVVSTHLDDKCACCSVCLCVNSDVASHVSSDVGSNRCSLGPRGLLLLLPGLLHQRHLPPRDDHQLKPRICWTGPAPPHRPHIATLASLRVSSHLVCHRLTHRHEPWHLPQHPSK